MAYDSDWLSVLASGSSLAINPLLVKDSGETNIPDGTNKVFQISSGKTIDGLQVLLSTDAGATWTRQSIVSSLTATNQVKVDLVKNEVEFYTAPPTSALIVVSNENQNKPLQVSTPKSIAYIEHKVIATNSHDIKEGCMVTFVGTDKIPTSDLANKLESEYLSDVVIDEDGNLLTTPKHTEFTLNSSDSSAVKFHKYISNDGYFVIETKELVYNSITTSFDGDNELFDNIDTDLNGNPIKTRTLVQRLNTRSKK